MLTLRHDRNSLRTSGRQTRRPAPAPSEKCTRRHDTHEPYHLDHPLLCKPRAGVEPADYATRGYFFGRGITTRFPSFSTYSTVAQKYAFW